ncbi:hypothetical protein COLU111180_14500 [Cohnella lubricantis]|uniref:Uncharacterized protein n=1 Tax=Cohnella lubricantis TaxID=2163172 RepID=A0A841T9C2_9BACL|nr:hypothetical protein [Cohnella lubricantis]MBB6676636.1 hypothetical protein [Cohnella lubricantis]MBP2117353.1 hypothetical protein [Cohnella lubricantis]
MAKKWDEAYRLFQSAEMGALPTLYASTEPSLSGGEYIGPGGKGAKRGYPALDPAIDGIDDPIIAGRLWEVSEQLTGILYSFQSHS